MIELTLSSDSKHLADVQLKMKKKKKKKKKKRRGGGWQ